MIALITTAVRADPIVIQGVRVHTQFDKDVYFPQYRQRPPYSAKCTQSSRYDKLIAIRDIKRFLAKYKKKVIKENLRNIFVCRTLMFHGNKYAGTYIGRNLYIDNNDPQFHLHHEFSSILMRNSKYRFPYRTWENLRSMYGNTGVSVFMERKMPAYKQSVKLFRRGFYIAYARSNLENDFNVIAEYYMTERTKLRQISSKYPRLKAKYEIVDKMYKRIVR